MQNEYDIRNQHEKLHQIAKILSKYFFLAKLDLRGKPQDKIYRKNG
jgi:hypothetical protein